MPTSSARRGPTTCSRSAVASSGSDAASAMSAPSTCRARSVRQDVGELLDVARAGRRARSPVSGIGCSLNTSASASVTASTRDGPVVLQGRGADAGAGGDGVVGEARHAGVGEQPERDPGQVRRCSRVRGGRAAPSTSSSIGWGPRRRRGRAGRSRRPRAPSDGDDRAHDHRAVDAVDERVVGGRGDGAGRRPAAASRPPRGRAPTESFTACAAAGDAASSLEKAALPVIVDA